MAIEHLLDLPGKDILARDDQHLFEAAGDVEMAVVVKLRDVAAPQVATIIKSVAVSTGNR